MSESPPNRRFRRISLENSGISAAIEPIIPALNGEIQPAPLLPVDSLTLLDAAALSTANQSSNRPPREPFQSQIRNQLRQVLGIGQPHNHANTLQEMAGNLQNHSVLPAVQQPLIQDLNPPFPSTDTIGEQITSPFQQGFNQSQQVPGLLINQTSSLLTLDTQLRTPLLQALNLSQQELTPNQARLQAFRTAVETSLQQTLSVNSQPNTPSDPLVNGTFAETNLNLTIDPDLLGSKLANTREDFIFLADCSFRLQRQEELLAHVRSFFTISGPKRDLIKNERYFIAVGYKDSIRGVRDSWRKIKKTELEEKDAFKLYVSSKYRFELEEKMRSVCTEGLQVSSGLLSDTTVSMETRLCFFKVKGDLYRYMVEYSTGAEKAEAASQGRSCYEEANRIKNCVSAVHPLRLGLALNFGVFLRDVCQDSSRGWQVTKMALDDANKGFQMLVELDSSDYRESNGLLMNLRRNLMLWNTTEIEVDEQNNAPTNQLAVRS